MAVYTILKTKHSDNLIPYNIMLVLKFEQVKLCYLFLCLNLLDAADAAECKIWSDLSLLCLLRPVCQNT